LSQKNSLGSASGRASTERRKTNRKKENVPNQTSIGSASKRTLTERRNNKIFFALLCGLPFL
jgi:hypothetical protein